MNGKGSKPRPFSVDRKTFDDNWNAIFGNKDPLQQIVDISQEMGFYEETYNPLVKPMSTREVYEGYSWIKVKRAKPIKLHGEMYVTEEHHIEETTFLIEEVRKLAKELDDLKRCSDRTKEENG